MQHPNVVYFIKNKQTKKNLKAIINSNVYMWKLCMFSLSWSGITNWRFWLEAWWIWYIKEINVKRYIFFTASFRDNRLHPNIRYQLAGSFSIWLRCLKSHKNWWEVRFLIPRFECYGIRNLSCCKRDIWRSHPQ